MINVFKGIERKKTIFGDILFIFLSSNLLLTPDSDWLDCSAWAALVGGLSQCPWPERDWSGARLGWMAPLTSSALPVASIDLITTVHKEPCVPSNKELGLNLSQLQVYWSL